MRANGTARVPIPPHEPPAGGERRYAEVRPEIQDGDVLLFQGRRLLSYAIRWVTGSQYSHAGVVARWGERLMVLEADEAGVIAVPISRCVQTYYGGVEWWTFDGPLDRPKVVDDARTQLGKRFAVWGMIRVLRRFWSRQVVARVAPDPKRPPTRFFCAQYVSFAYRAGGVDLVPPERDDVTTPADIATAHGMRRIAVLKR